MSGARAAAAASALGILASAPVALAELKLSLDVSPRKVEIGAQFSAQLTLTSDGRDRVGEPELKLPDGVGIFGKFTSRAGNMSIRWMLMANRAGRFKIGPASVMTDQGLKQVKGAVVEVVPQGTLTNKQPPLGGQAIDPFSMLRGFGGPSFRGLPGFPSFPGDPEPELAPVPEGYRIDHAPDPIAFLRATAEPRQVVVGEQVTASFYAYAGRGDFGAAFFGEPTRVDFLAVSMGEDDVGTKYPLELDGKRWISSKVQSYALFPLKAGKLTVGSMSMGFAGPGYSNAPQGLLRKSKPIDIEVVEPPLQGRPPGYHLGDVGQFSLSAQVEPREVPVDGSISIIAKLQGTGNMPYALQVPEQDGVHFLEPQLVGQPEPRRGVIQGSRTFTYVVELTRPGELDLGEIVLPFYDAKARAYGVARAALGKVKVTGSPKLPAAATKPTSNGPSLKGLLAPPETLGPSVRATASYWPSRPGYWILLLALPLSPLLGFALSDLARLLRRRFAERRGSLTAALDDALLQLAQAARSGDSSAVAGAAERALFLAIERATNIKGRGILKSELSRALAEAQVPSALADQAAALLGRCDELRFTGAAVELPSFAAEVRETCQKFAQLQARAPGAA